MSARTRRIPGRSPTGAAVLVLAAMLSMALAARMSIASDEPVLTVVVTDAAGNAVPDAEAYLIENTYSMPLSLTWRRADAAGIARFDRASFKPDTLPEGRVQPSTLVVRSPRHAWSTRIVSVPSAEIVRVSLDEGRLIEVRLAPPEGASLPDELTPIIFAEGQSVAAWLTQVQRFNSDEGSKACFNAALPRRIGEGRFNVRVPGDCENIWVLVNHPGFLRAFQAGPFATRSGEGLIEAALPRPATLAIRLVPDQSAAHDYRNCGVVVFASPEIPDGGWSFTVFSEYVESQSLQADLTDLAPQYYYVNAVTGTKADQKNRDRPDFFSTQSSARPDAGGREEVAFALQTYDEASLRARLKGDHTLTVRVTNADGSPAAGKEYELSFLLQQFGRNLSIQKGTLPESGEFTVSGLPKGGQEFLEVSIDGKGAGYVFLREDELQTTIEVSIAPAVGTMAPDIEFTRLDDGSVFRLSSLRGQVVYLDFWASWCGPCQEPMAHSDALIARRTDWKGKAVIIGASIDNGIEIIREHVGKRGWNNVLQAYCSEGNPGWECDAVKRYAVRGVPTCYLIDQQGRIAWTGHPSGIDVESEIDALLKR